MSGDEHDDLLARMRRLEADGRSDLLDDLESIRALLDAEQSTDAAGTAPEDDLAHIPVLREVVRPAVVPSTSRATGAMSPTAAPPRDQEQGPEAAGRDAPEEAAGTARANGSTEVQGDLFDPRAFADRLLNEEWRAQRDAILEDARAGARALAGSAQPGSERFDAQLHARLVASLGARVEELLDDALHDLRTILHRTVRDELERLFADCFEAAPGQTSNPDETD